MYLRADTIFAIGYAVHTLKSCLEEEEDKERINFIYNTIILLLQCCVVSKENKTKPTQWLPQQNPPFAFGNTKPEVVYVTPGSTPRPNFSSLFSPPNQPFSF